jgi:hypothetical protein
MDERITDQPPKPWGGITDKSPVMGSRPGENESKVSRWWKWLLSLGIISLLVWGFDRAGGLYWTGQTDLEIEIAATEAGSDRRIPGASVEVESWDLSERLVKREFVLLADEGGVVRKAFPRTRSTGSRSGLGFTDTFGVYLPMWRFRVSAAGYQSSEWIDLQLSEYARHVKRLGSGKSLLPIQVPLQKVQPAAPVPE